MSRKYFGTDGIRGVANTKLTADFALKLGYAVGAWVRANGEHKRVVIGRDTRRSGKMLEAALASGLSAYGVEVVSVGIAPTPAVAFIARTQAFDLGVIISASHNPAPDNGIKFVTHTGTKSSDALELEWESALDSPAEREPGLGVGDISEQPELLESYLDFLVGVVPEGLSGFKVAVDAANGAAYHLGPEVLKRLGAEVLPIGVEPDGMNINAEGGATKPQTVQDFVVASGAHVGVAFDGDADRAVFSDEKGRLINGDRTMGIWAAHYQSKGKLNPPIVVGTVMSNGGFEAFLTSKAIKLERTAVGDKYVSQRIGETHARVGGEQSGHIVFPERGPTGDGLVTMLELFRVLKAEGRSPSAFYDDYEPWPQLMVNVAVADKTDWEARIADVTQAAEARVAGHGRLVVRASGTQPMIRVMAEADNYPVRDEVTESVVEALVSRLGGHVEGRVDLTYALGD